ncbi:MAG TPA: hypothetical protein VMK65_04280 [Longimicrobiales bacterium]|nr:hypothetical protein [Longimicrobiales bacterium]
MARMTLLWLALLLGGAALIAGRALPPEGSPFMSLRERQRTPLQRMHRQLQREVALANDMLRRNWRAREVMARLPVSGGALAVEVPEGSGGRGFAQRVRSEVEGMVPRSRLGAFMLAAERGGDPRLGAGLAQPALEYYAGTDADGPFCAVVAPFGRVFPPPEEMARVWPTTLGPCLLFARHGAPGAAMAAWLEGGGYRFATEPVAPPRQGVPRRMAFGLRRIFVRGELVAIPFLGESCLAGRLDACRAIVMEGPGADDGAALVMHTPLSHVRTRTSSSESEPFGRFTGSLLFDVEAEVGPQRFASLWSAEDSFEEAFQAAVGEPLPQWVQRWAGTRLGSAGAGPGMAWSTAGLGLLAVLGLAAAAVLRHARRQPG